MNRPRALSFALSGLWGDIFGSYDKEAARRKLDKILRRRTAIGTDVRHYRFERLWPECIRIHQAGIIRAVASALDCLAGVMIGVAALSMSILKVTGGQDRAVASVSCVFPHRFVISDPSKTTCEPVM
jgi:hypothetical protein